MVLRDYVSRAPINKPFSVQEAEQLDEDMLDAGLELSCKAVIKGIVAAFLGDHGVSYFSLQR